MYKPIPQMKMPTAFNQQKHFFPENPQIDTFTQKCDMKDGMKSEFQELVKDKLSKIDEILIALKEKQDLILTSQSSLVQNQPLQEFQTPQHQLQQPEPTLQKKQSRNKRTYYPITESMWSTIKATYQDLNDDYKSHTLSDGENYYVECKGKKILLDGKGYLKLLNSKKS